MSDFEDVSLEEYEQYCLVARGMNMPPYSYEEYVAVAREHFPQRKVKVKVSTLPPVGDKPLQQAAEDGGDGTEHHE